MPQIDSTNCNYFLSQYLGIGLHILLNSSLFLLLLVLLRKHALNSGITKIGLILVFVGGTLNIVERWATGCVSDYISFFGLLYFNIFDILVVTGLVLIGYYLVAKERSV